MLFGGIGPGLLPRRPGDGVLHQLLKDWIGPRPFVARSPGPVDGAVAEAIEIWERMVDEVPGPHAGTSALAWTYLEMEEFEKSIGYFEKILEAIPNDAHSQNGLARAREGLAR